MEGDLSTNTGIKGGRPSIFTAKLATDICERIAEGESLRSICRDEKMPAISTVMKWLLEADKKTFSEQYDIACNARAELMFEELLEIADDGTNDYLERERQDGTTFETLNGEHIQRSRLRVDTRKWYLSKVLPKKFGDKQAVELTGKDGSPLFSSLKELSDGELERLAAGSAGGAS